jgi:hypothetical protein
VNSSKTESKYSGIVPLAQRSLIISGAPFTYRMYLSEFKSLVIIDIRFSFDVKSNLLINNNPEFYDGYYTIAIVSSN